jgi:hypothetical protein
MADEITTDAVEKVKFNLGDYATTILDIDNKINMALLQVGNDPNLATYLILRTIATQKAISFQRATLGNKTIVESVDDLLKVAQLYRDSAGEFEGELPPLVGVHTDGRHGDNRSEFDSIGIEGVKEGKRKDKNIKPGYGDGETL